MKSKFVFRTAAALLFFACAFCFLLLIGACSDENSNAVYTLVYKAADGGSIVGKAEQECSKNVPPETVTAVADSGYVFAGWSDGFMDAARLDDGTKSVNVTAFFELEKATLNYHYNLATGGFDGAFLQIERDNQNNAQAAVPTREHFKFLGWYADSEMTQKVTDEKGVFADVNLFSGDIQDLYARWQPAKEDIVSYDVLLVFVTEVKAEGIVTDSGIVNVAYSMTQEQRTECERLAGLFKDKLNEMYEGLVIMNVDAYYTREAVGADAITAIPTVGHQYRIMAENLPELKGSELLSKHRSVITCFSFGGAPMHGEADFCEPYVLLDGLFASETTEVAVLKDMIFAFSDSCSAVYGGHTIQNINAANSAWFEGKADIDQVKMYLLGCLPKWFKTNITEQELCDAMLNSENIGIPYSYWRNEFFEVKVISRTTVLDDGEDSFYCAAKFDGYNAMNDEVTITQGDGTYTITIESTYRLCAGTDVTLRVYSGEYAFLGWDDDFSEVERKLHIDEDMSFGVSFIESGLAQ